MYEEQINEVLEVIAKSKAKSFIDLAEEIADILEVDNQVIQEAASLLQEGYPDDADATIINDIPFIGGMLVSTLPEWMPKSVELGYRKWTLRRCYRFCMTFLLDFIRSHHPHLTNEIPDQTKFEMIIADRIYDNAMEDTQMYVTD